MPGRITPLITGEYYHILNRGSDNRNIFLQPRDYKRFRQTIYYYQFSGPKPKLSLCNKFALNTYKPFANKKLVDIICYCLMPNHFHFLVSQRVEGGISQFMSQVSNSYTKHFNTKYRRLGPLLQGAFKAILVETDEQLIHLSRYIHLNPIASNLIRNLDRYQWSSYSEYMLSPRLCSTKEILGFFKSKEEYKKFLEDQVDYAQTLEIIKHSAIDEE